MKVVGQPPCLVEQLDDKDYVNNVLRAKGTFTMPRGWSVKESPNVEADLTALNLPYPIVGKPVRGRGSHGVKVCHTVEELIVHVKSLLDESPAIMLEEFLSGEEATVTIMPPSEEHPDYWCMPIVTRFNHQGGIAPYNGVVAVTSNSRAVKKDEYARDPSYDVAARECEAVAKLFGLTAPMRIDIRRFKDDSSSKFALFDVNMKPVCNFFFISLH